MPYPFQGRYRELQAQLLASFAMFCAANQDSLKGLSITYIAARLLHMLCYYFDVRIARSAEFAASLLAMAGMFWGEYRSLDLALKA